MLLIIKKSIFIILSLMILSSYSVLLERKIIAFIQQRIGPNKVGFYGILQPIADAIKAFSKENICPKKSNKFLFYIAPIISIILAFVSWTIIPFNTFIFSNIDLGILFILSTTSLNLYAILIAGWSSNSKYPLLGAIRSCAQVISYEISMSFSVIGVVILSGNMNIYNIVIKQKGGILHWNMILLFPLLIIYWICAIAETNRLPFDVAEGESELVAGFHAEYSSISFALFFLAEYSNMLLLSVFASLIFLGGWLPPYHVTNQLKISVFFWLFIKSLFFLFSLFWIRGTLPRYRYDQIMNIGWKFLIPISLGWIILASIIYRFL